MTKIASLGVVLLASLFHWVSGIKEAYKGLLNGDILVGVKRLLQEPKRVMDSIGSPKESFNLVIWETRRAVRYVYR